MHTPQMREYQVAGRARPTEANPVPKIYRMRVFAPNPVQARSRFWYVRRDRGCVAVVMLIDGCWLLIWVLVADLNDVEELFHVPYARRSFSDLVLRCFPSHSRYFLTKLRCV